ncbi:MAG TPA: pyridoxal-phosphate dependent enzyme, partial [Saprospiraceae bacterium]|nr:pyridoxal-phosphate dependent enzyme [Saprospiraceae bacterium]
MLPTGEENQLNPGYISRLISHTYQRISDHVIQTRLVFDAASSLWLKCENEQETGSFKWRGALSKLSLFTPGQTIITASTGNHGLG